METTYFCDSCKKRRQVLVSTGTEHLTRNGLILETDIHRCKSGQLRVFNLFIDHDSNTRTVENIEIPELKTENRTILRSLPTPGTMKSEMKQLKLLQVSSLTKQPGIRIILLDAFAKYNLNLGNVQTTEKPEFIISSELNTIELAYYTSEISPSDSVKLWLQEFVDLIEKLPTNYLGNYLLGLRYIQSMCTITPENRDLRVLDMILSSSEIGLRPKREFDPTRFMSEKGGSEFDSKTLTDLFKLLSKIENEPEITLSTLAAGYKNDIITLCNKLLVLEDRKHIEIARPEELGLRDLLLDILEDENLNQ